MDDKIIILRSVYGKVEITYSIQPCKDPRTGKYPDCVKRVDSFGNMIMTDAERNSNAPVIPENKTFKIKDGDRLDLSDPWQAAQWDAIKHCPLIAQSRDARDSKGNLIIDGDAKRYGRAELYVERPLQEVTKKITRRQLIHDAESYIFQDPAGADGRLKMARILGKRMRNAPDADIKDFLLEIASKSPEKIINLYTGDDIELRILFMEARDRGVIHSKGGIYFYGDTTAIGGTMDVAVNWMRDPKNSKVLELLKKDTYPDMYEVNNPNYKGKKMKD